MESNGPDSFVRTLFANAFKWHLCRIEQLRTIPDIGLVIRLCYKGSIVDTLIQQPSVSIGNTQGKRTDIIQTLNTLFLAFMLLHCE